MMLLPPPKKTRQLNDKSLLFGITTQRAFRISQDGGVIFLEEIGTWSYTRVEQSAQQQLWRSIIRPGQRHASPTHRNSNSKRHRTAKENATAPQQRKPSGPQHRHRNATATTVPPTPSSESHRDNITATANDNAATHRRQMTTTAQTTRPKNNYDKIATAPAIASKRIWVKCLCQRRQKPRVDSEKIAYRGESTLP